MRETLVIHSRLSWRQARGAAAIERQHGLQAAIEHVAARLAGGFLQPINSDSLKEAIGEAIAMDLVRQLHHIDHFSPKSHLQRRQLEKLNCDSAYIDDCLDARDRLANLQLLEGLLNVAKNDSLPAEWVASS